MNEFEPYKCHKVQVRDTQRSGKPEIKKFSDMTRGQVILLLRQRGYTNWKFITESE